MSEGTTSNKCVICGATQCLGEAMEVHSDDVPICCKHPDELNKALGLLDDFADDEDV